MRNILALATTIFALSMSAAQAEIGEGTIIDQNCIETVAYVFTGSCRLKITLDAKQIKYKMPYHFGKHFQKGQKVKVDYYINIFGNPKITGILN